MAGPSKGMHLLADSSRAQDADAELEDEIRHPLRKMTRIQNGATGCLRKQLLSNSL
jgi:hypothetical protein